MPKKVFLYINTPEEVEAKLDYVFRMIGLCFLGAVAFWVVVIAVVLIYRALVS